jgi:hypothetical protein
MKLEEILKSSDCWTKGQLARDHRNASMSYTDPKAVKFCLVGALHRLYSEPCEGASNEGCRRLSEATITEAGRKLAKIIATHYPEYKVKDYVSDRFWDTIIGFNDNDATTFEMVEKVVKEYDN